MSRKSDPRLAELSRSLATLVREQRALKRAPVGALPGQPFDRLLLSKSALYRRSRKLYREGGEFEPALLSSERSLSSVSLVAQKIQFSPVEDELLWAAGAKSVRALELRTWVTSVFHEQNHRVLWRHLPPPPAARATLRRYLNFAESLVVMLDMALADGLGERVARPLWLAGSIYDPGSAALSDIGKGRPYRNYLQAALLGTYLYMEGFDPRRIPHAVASLFPACSEIAERAADRACRLDRSFVTNTNPLWQRRHASAAAAALAKPAVPPLELPSDPMDARLAYLWGERTLDLLDI